MDEYSSAGNNTVNEVILTDLHPNLNVDAEVGSVL
jgi:hypothetical protein